MQNPQKDTDLVREAQKDQRKFAAIYNRYIKVIYRYFLFRVGRSREVAQDLAQETFLRAFKNLRTFSIRSTSYFSYLLRIAHNLLVNYYRKAKPGSLESVPEQSMSYEIKATLEDKLSATRLLSRLERLSPEDRALLKMKYQDELPLRDIARQLGKSESAIKSALYKARSRAKKLLEEKPPPPTTV